LQEILEKIILLKKFVDVFRQCKQLLNNKRLQLNSYNSKLRLKISWTQFIRELRSKAIYLSIIWSLKISKIFKFLIILLSKFQI